MFCISRLITFVVGITGGSLILGDQGRSCKTDTEVKHRHYQDSVAQK